MKRVFVKRAFPQVLAWAGLVVLCSAIAVAQGQTQASDATTAQAGQRSDGQIEMDVVHALDASSALKNDLITAATIQGEVSLSGTVSTEASRQLAESIASHVNGVIKVNNNLKVGNPQDAQDAQAQDPGAQQMADNEPDDAAQAPPPPAYGQAQSPNQGQDQSQAQGQAPAPYPQSRPQYAPQQPYPPQQYPPQQYPPRQQYPPQQPYAQGPGVSGTNGACDHSAGNDGPGADQ